jgi:hypothetical protein
MLGVQVQRYPGVAVAGHEAAVHGFSHRSPLARGPADVRWDVARAAAAISVAQAGRESWSGTVCWARSASKASTTDAVSGLRTTWAGSPRRAAC